MARIVKTSQQWQKRRVWQKIWKNKNARRLRGAILREKPNIMLRHNVISICLSGLQSWSSINVASLSRANHLHRPKGVFVKRSKHSRIRSLLLSPSVVTSLRKKFPLTPIPLCHDSGDLLCHAIFVRIASFQEAPLETWLEFSLNLWPIIAKSPFPPCSSFRQIRGPFGHVIRILFKPVRQSFVKSPFSQNLSDWPILEVACDQFESCLQFTCGSPSTKPSDFRLSAGSGNDRECKQTLKNAAQRVMTLLMSYAPISISQWLFRCRH